MDVHIVLTVEIIDTGLLLIFSLVRERGLDNLRAQGGLQIISETAGVYMTTQRRPKTAQDVQELIRDPR